MHRIPALASHTHNTPHTQTHTKHSGDNVVPIQGPASAEQSETLLEGRQAAIKAVRSGEASASTVEAALDQLGVRLALAALALAVVLGAQQVRFCNPTLFSIDLRIGIRQSNTHLPLLLLLFLLFLNLQALLLLYAAPLAERIPVLLEALAAHAAALLAGGATAASAQRAAVQAARELATRQLPSAGVSSLALGRAAVEAAERWRDVLAAAGSSAPAGIAATLDTLHAVADDQRARLRQAVSVLSTVALLVAALALALVFGVLVPLLRKVRREWLERQRLEREAAYEQLRRLRQRELVARATGEMVRHIEMRELVWSIMRESRRLVSAQSCILFMLSEDGRTLWARDASFDYETLGAVLSGDSSGDESSSSLGRRAAIIDANNPELRARVRVDRSPDNLLGDALLNDRALNLDGDELRDDDRWRALKIRMLNSTSSSIRACARVAKSVCVMPLRQRSAMFGVLLLVNRQVVDDDAEVSNDTDGQANESRDVSESDDDEREELDEDAGDNEPIVQDIDELFGKSWSISPQNVSSASLSRFGQCANRDRCVFGRR